MNGASEDRTLGEDILIRPARPADADALERLFDEMDHPDSAEGLARYLAALANSKTEAALVAESEGHVIAMATIHIFWMPDCARPIGELTALCVTDSVRGRGVGGHMLKAVEDFCRDRGCVRLELVSNRRRERAHDFYRRAGYVDSHFQFRKDLTPNRA